MPGLASIRIYLAEHHGSVATTFALAALPMLLAAGLAIDMLRISREQASLSEAVDGAILAITASDRSNFEGLSNTDKTSRTAELEELAHDFIKANYRPETGDVDSLAITLVITEEGDISLDARRPFPTAIMSLAGIKQVAINARAESQRLSVRDKGIEIALVIDTTGSMKGSYIDSAKQAANELLAILYGGKTTSSLIKAGLIPFSGAVRLDKSTIDMAWIDTSGSAEVSKLNFNASLNNYGAWGSLQNTPWNGCVEARLGDLAVNDTEPTSGDTLFTPYFAPDEPTLCSTYYKCSMFFGNTYIDNGGTPNEQTGLSSTSTSMSNLFNRQKNAKKYSGRSIAPESTTDMGPWFNCAKSPIVPLSNDRGVVEAGISAMEAGGSTVIPEGLAWGWRVLSPEAPFTEGVPYGDDNWNKVLVLMTDGENDVLSAGAKINDLNGSWYNAYGYATATVGNRFGSSNWAAANGALDARMDQVCGNIKAAGITIYTVAFRVTSRNILERLKSCASSPDDYLFAPDGDTLRSKFQQIGAKVVAASLRLKR